MFSAYTHPPSLVYLSVPPGGWFSKAEGGVGFSFSADVKWLNTRIFRTLKFQDFLSVRSVKIRILGLSIKLSNYLRFGAIGV